MNGKKKWLICVAVIAALTFASVGSANGLTLVIEWDSLFGGGPPPYWNYAEPLPDDEWGYLTKEYVCPSPCGKITELLKDYRHEAVGWDSAQSVQQTSDGGYIIAGYLTKQVNNDTGFQLFPYSDTDVWLIKTYSNGTTQWDKIFGLKKMVGYGYIMDMPERAYSVQQTSDGGYIIAGDNDGDVWLIKTDSNGNELWNRTFGGYFGEGAYAVQQTTDGGYIIAGYMHFPGGSDAWLIKTDSNGAELWNKTFGGSEYEEAKSVQQTIDGGYIIAGYTRSYGAGELDAWLIKTDSNGIESWNRTFGGAFDDGAYAVQQTSDGGYIIAGYIGGEYPCNGEYCTSADAWLIKTDSNGYELWNRTLGVSDWAGARSVQQTKDGGYIIAGYTWTWTPEGNNLDFWLIKTDSNGLMQWNQTFGGSSSRNSWMPDDGCAVLQTTDGSYVFAGIREICGSNYHSCSTDVRLVKLREWIEGDVNRDGEVNMGDVGLLHNHIQYGYPLDFGG